LRDKDVFSFIEDDSPQPLYCPYCEKIPLKIKLQPRLFEDDIIPSDADNWLQCYRCGRVVELHNVKEEVEFGPIVDIIENPFDSGTEILAVDKKRKAHKRKKKDTEIDEQGTVNVLYDSSGRY
jgi:hypothetical protein